jgi:hypothetical protein
VWNPAGARGQIAAAGLRQAAGDHVADREDGRVEPDLAGAEAAGVRRVDDGPGDQDAGEDQDEGEESVVLNAAFVSVARRRTVVRDAGAPFSRSVIAAASRC